MAPRLPVIGWWKQGASRMRSYATSSQPKQMAYAPPLEAVSRLRLVQGQKGDMVPVYVAVGMVTLSVSMGLHTAYNQMKNAPSVRVNKKLRETLPEVAYPEKVAEEADRFFGNSFFRKVAHVQDAYAYPPRVETLKSVGVDPKLHA